jgi:ribosomal protein L17
MIQDFEDPNGMLRNNLRREHMTEEAIEATCNRAKEMKARLEYMAQKAEVFLEAMYNEGDSRQRSDHFRLSIPLAL